MKRDQYWGKPKDAKVRRGDAEAWWYADEGGIELHVEAIPVRGNHVVIRLRRSELARYLVRSSR